VLFKNKMVDVFWHTVYIFDQKTMTRVIIKSESKWAIEKRRVYDAASPGDGGWQDVTNSAR